LSGDLIFGPNLVDATIYGIASIRGDLVIANAVNLVSVSAPDVDSIGGVFNLTGLTRLATLNFPVLSSVGSIYWQTLPALQGLDFGTSVTQADQVIITDTILESLTGINLDSVAQFNINNNRYLKEVTVQLTNITDSLSIEFNSPQLAASFPNLTWANNATFRSCGSVFLPVLEVVNGSLGFFNNSFTEFKAPKLVQVGTTENGDISFNNNPALKNVSMPVLKTIHGTLQFANDTKLEQIEGFPVLAEVFGSIDISGVFDEADFPAIKSIRGGFNLQTTAKFDCSNFDKLQNGVVQGSYVCSGAVENPGSEGTTPTTTGSGSSSTGKNAAGRLSATNSFAAIAGLTFVALFL